MDPLSILMLSSPPSAGGPLPKIVPELEVEFRRKGAVVEVLPWGSRGSGQLFVTRLFDRFSDAMVARRYLSERPNTVLLVHTTHDWRSVPRDLVLLALCRRPAACVVLVLHGGDPERVTRAPTSLLARLTRAVVGMADAVAVLSSEEAASWRQVATRTHVRIVRNPLPTPPDRANGDPQRPQRPRVLFVGRLIPTKGCLDLVDAFRAVRDGFDCELRIVGEGPQRKAISDAVEQAGLTADVTMTGTLDGSSLEDEYSEATVLALPTSNEGLPTVVLEAMARGVPVVTTRIRGSADYFTDAHDVLFVNPGRSDELAQAIRRLLGDGELRRRLAQAAREAVRQFDSDRVISDYEHLVHDALSAAGDRKGVS